MVDLLATYGPSGALVAAIYVLARVIERLVDSRRRSPVAEEGARITMHDLREDIHWVRDISQANAAQLGVLKNDVDWIKRTMKANGHGDKE